MAVRGGMRLDRLNAGTKKQRRAFSLLVLGFETHMIIPEQRAPSLKHSEPMSKPPPLQVRPLRNIIAHV
jgi:hypothetical protein